MSRSSTTATRSGRSASSPPPSRSFLNTSFNNMPSGIAREGRPTALRASRGARARWGSATATGCASATDAAASSSTPAPSTGCSGGVVIVEGHLAQPCLRGRDRDQSADQRRSWPAARRRRVSRHRGMAEAGMKRGCWTDERRISERPADRGKPGRGRRRGRRLPARAAASRRRVPRGGRGRLIFALDATASREPTWDRACRIQGEMFEATAALGGLDVQLVYYRGFDECKASRWMSTAADLHRVMRAVVLRRRRDPDRARARAMPSGDRRRRVNALVFVGDAMEESVDRLCRLAGELGLLGVPIFLFHEGGDRRRARPSRQIARAVARRLSAPSTWRAPTGSRSSWARSRSMPPAAIARSAAYGERRRAATCLRLTAQTARRRAAMLPLLGGFAILLRASAARLSVRQRRSGAARPHSSNGAVSRSARSSPSSRFSC